MRILIIVDVYPPEISSASKLIQELARGLNAAGDEVFIATTFPRNYLATDVLTGGFKEFSKEDGINIIRVKTPPLKKVNFIIRGISQLLLPFLVFRKVKKYIKGNLDSVIVYSPPLPLAIAGHLVKNKYEARFMLNLWDIFPQNAIDLGILKNKLGIKLFEAIEKFAYKKADILTFHAEHGRQFLIDEKGVSPGKIFLLPHWVDLSSYGNKSKRDFRKEYGLGGKLIFLFGGIMGPAQGLEFLIEVADKVKEHKNAVFLLVGDGMDKEKISNMVKSHNLQNVIIKNFVSVDDYPDLIGCADVGVVCLSSKNKTPFVPGKFMGYMAAGKPVLAFLNKESDGFELVEKADCGFVVVSGNLEEATKATQELCAINKKDLLLKGNNGLAYVKKHLSLETAVEKIRKLIIN